jgi:hypothetical protein
MQDLKGMLISERKKIVERLSIGAGVEKYSEYRYLVGPTHSGLLKRILRILRFCQYFRITRSWFVQ